MNNAVRAGMMIGRGMSQDLKNDIISVLAVTDPDKFIEIIEIIKKQNVIIENGADFGEFNYLVNKCGAYFSSIFKLAKSGSKVDAIKKTREVTNVSLEEGVKFVNFLTKF